MKDYPLVLSSEVLSQEVPYLGGVAEMNFYVEGLRFPDKDFDGLISINLSLLEPICEVRSETWHPQCYHLYFISYHEFLMLFDHLFHSIFYLKQLISFFHVLSTTCHTLPLMIWLQAPNKASCRYLEIRYFPVKPEMNLFA